MLRCVALQCVVGEMKHKDGDGDAVVAVDGADKTDGWLWMDWVLCCGGGTRDIDLEVCGRLSRRYHKTGRIGTGIGAEEGHRVALVRAVL